MDFSSGVFPYSMVDGEETIKYKKELEFLQALFCGKDEIRTRGRITPTTV